MAKLKIKRDDSVVVISGAESGKTGRILHVDRDKLRVVVEGINRRHKTARRSQDNPQGGILEVECPIHISNIMLEERYRKKHPDTQSEPAETKSADQGDA